LDYTNTLSDQLSIETGVKATMSRFNNKVVVTSEVDGESSTNEQLSNDSNLSEDIFAAYFSWQWDMAKSITLNGGLRYEFTDSYLSTPEEKGLVDRSFGNFFPSLFIAKRLNDRNKIQMAYSRRISRPTFNEMAPYVFFIGPSTFVGGNLDLKPAITNGFDLTYQFGRWQLSAKYDYTSNSIAFLQPEINAATNELIFRSQNLKYVSSWGFATNFPIRVASWWEIQNDFSIYHQTYETNHLNRNIKDNVVSMNLNIINSFTLPNDYSIELSGDYHSNSLWGISRFEPMGKINLGFKKKLKNDMGILTLSVNDMFNGSVWKIETRVPEFNLTSHFNYDFSTRSINLTYTKNFGNKKLKSVDIDSGSEAERKRVN
jgi:outer membrane receptor for ferrienterochelin and colicin